MVSLKASVNGCENIFTSREKKEAATLEPSELFCGEGVGKRKDDRADVGFEVRLDCSLSERGSKDCPPYHFSNFPYNPIIPRVVPASFNYSRPYES